MRRAWWVIDLVAVLLFVGIGRSVHAHGLSITGMTATAWPFVSGLVFGWLVLGILRFPPHAIVSGVIVSVLTVAIGMALRVVAGQGTALAFVLVAAGFLGAAMVGWRILASLLERLRPSDRVS